MKIFGFFLSIIIFVFLAAQSIEKPLFYVPKGWAEPVYDFTKNPITLIIFQCFFGQLQEAGKCFWDHFKVVKWQNLLVSERSHMTSASFWPILLPIPTVSKCQHWATPHLIHTPSLRQARDIVMLTGQSVYDWFKQLFNRIQFTKDVICESSLIS